eukprot:gene10762-12534_t
MSSFLYTVKYFFILDSKGTRIATKYYAPDFDTVAKQKSFERKVFDKTVKVNGEIALLENHLVVYKAYSNVIIYFVGDKDQNEIALLNVLNAYIETLNALLEGTINKKTLLDGINFTLLTLDELIDEGILLESDPAVMADRVGIRLQGDNEVDLDQSLGQVFNSAREQLASFLK